MKKILLSLLFVGCVSQSPSAPNVVNKTPSPSPSPVVVVASSTINSSSPDAVSGLKLWLKASDLNLSNGSAVGDWGGCVSSSYINSPTFISDTQNDLNGQPTVRYFADINYPEFNNFLDCGPTSNFISPNGYSVIVVTRLNNLKAGQNAILWSSDFFFGFAISSGTLNQDVAGEYVQGNQELGYHRPNGSWAGYYGIATSVVSAVSQALYFNGQAQTLTPSAIAISESSVNLFVGNALEADISEVILYDNAISETDRKNVECGLSTKYSLTISGC
jgi:hypothetical protein